MEVSARRPQRWDVPFGERMTEADVARLMATEPFRSMNPRDFTAAAPLRGILQYDTRIVDCQEGQVVVREGDYGNSAFLVLAGRVRVVLQSLPPQALGRHVPKMSGAWRALARVWSGSDAAEHLDRGASAAAVDDVAVDTPRIFLQDIPGVLEEGNSVVLGEGEVFGELAALSRSPRTATVIAEAGAQLLEIRWQGLRDLLRRAPALRAHIDKLYRENSLRVHLRETAWLKSLPEQDLRTLADETSFTSYGDFDWHYDFRASASEDSSTRVEAEPLIAAEGELPEHLVLIRSGFARVSHRHGSGHRTVAYLGKGQLFGLQELAEQWQKGVSQPLRCSLRAVGYVDVLKIPASVVQELVLPRLSRQHLTQLMRDRATSQTAAAPAAGKSIETGLLEFLVETRVMNGAQAMLVDLDRCTRCDDCVAACAATHDGNPRFVRSGPQYRNLQVASACMHCIDPVCMIGCPTGAIARDASTGRVLINSATCIGCSTCAESCPYDNIVMAEIRDRTGHPVIDVNTQQPILTATKCDLCAEQLTRPACQQACSHDALVRIDMTDLDAVSRWVNR